MSDVSGAEHLVAPLSPTLSRYRSLFGQKRKMSITRALQYEVLAQCRLEGKVLDIGGGNRADYHRIVKFQSYDSVNIDPAAEPSWVVQVGEELPCPDSHYDNILSLNTFEHIFDVQFVIREVSRVLKPGGEFLTSVPFLFPIHAHPDDFFRPTSSWWLHSLSQSGFENIRILPLVWGPFSTGLICSGTPGPCKALRTHIALLTDILYARWRTRRQSSGQHFRSMHDFALGFFVWATRAKDIRG